MTNKPKLLSRTGRAISLLLVFIMMATLILPTVSMHTAHAEQAGGGIVDFSDDSYLSGTGFEDLELGKVISDNTTYSHKIGGKSIYNAVPKNSKMTVIQERGNKFIRIERSARGKEGNVTNDPYFDFIDTKKTSYTGDFVVEASFRLNVHPDNFENINLFQFINRDNGNFFQPLIVLTPNRIVKHHLKNTDFSPELGQWFHVAAVIHRNTNTADTMDVYINSICVAKELKFNNDISSIDQLRVAQLNCSKPIAACMDVDDVSIYKGSKPRTNVKSGANSDNIIGSLDITHPSLSDSVAGKISTEQFEIDTKGNTFGVNDQLDNLLFGMERRTGEPYIDVFTDGATGALIADVGIILGEEWKCSARLLSPYSKSNGAVSPTNFIKINEKRQLTDTSGNVLAELGNKFNRIALALSADRKYAAVYVNGEEVMRAETKFTNGYVSPDGFRMFKFDNGANAGTIHVSYAEVYRGSAPAAAKESSVLNYYSDFSTSDTLPLTLSGTANQTSGAIGYYATAAAGSHIRYPSELAVDGLMVSFKLTLTQSADIALLKLGNTSLLSLNSIGQLTARSKNGDKTLFSLKGSSPSYLTVCIKDGHYTLYLNGLPFISEAALPEGVSEKVDHLELLSVKASVACNALIDDLEIYTDGIPSPVSAPAPKLTIAPHVPQKNNAQLSWKPLSDAKGYRLFRSEDGGAATDISGLLTNVSTYTDTAVWGDIEYAYTISAVYERNGEEYPASWQEASPTFCIKDNELNATASGIEGGVELSWNAYPAANLGYLVYRAIEENGEYVPLTQKPINELSYIDITASSELVMFYKVCVVLDKSGSAHVFGLKSKALEAVALYKEEPEEAPEPPKPPAEGGVENHPNGFDIPKLETKTIFESDFNTDITPSTDLTLQGTGISWTPNGKDSGNGALKLDLEARPADKVCAKLKLSNNSPGSTVIDMKLHITSLSIDTDLLCFSNGELQITTLLTLTGNSNGTVTLQLDGSVSDKTVTLSTVALGEWLRITVWINEAGNKAAFYINGSCVLPDVTLPQSNDTHSVYGATELMLISVDGETQGAGILPLSASASSTAVSILIDDLKIKKTSLFANVFVSSVLTPSVTTGTSENQLSWRAANGASHYTVWRADKNGDYTVIKDNLLTNSYAERYTEDCSYKVTYTFDIDGIELTSIPSTSGIKSNKKPVESIPQPPVGTKFFDPSQPGALGIMILFLAVLGCYAGFLVLRKVLKIDTPLPNKGESKAVSQDKSAAAETDSNISLSDK